MSVPTDVTGSVIGSGCDWQTEKIKYNYNIIKRIIAAIPYITSGGNKPSLLGCQVTMSSE